MKERTIDKEDKDQIFIFWVNSIRYKGSIVGETETHWIVKDIKYTENVELPKGNTVKLPSEMKNE